MSEFWSLVLGVHILCAVLWVGGMAFALLVLRPSLAVLEPPQRMALHQQVFRRFFLIVWHAMPLILVTGYLMLFVQRGGMANALWNIHVMLLFGVIMAVVFVAMFFGPYRRFRATPNAPTLDTIRKLISVNLVLGLLVVLVATFGG